MSKNLDIILLLDFYGNMLTDKQSEIMDYYYNEDLSLAEISEHMGITRQGVRDSIKRSEKQLHEFEEKLGLINRFKKISSQIEEIEINITALKTDIPDHLKEPFCALISKIEEVNELL